MTAGWGGGGAAEWRSHDGITSVGILTSACVTNEYLNTCDISVFHIT